MTREDIDNELNEYAIRQDNGIKNHWDCTDMIDFSLEMVRRHNNELAEIAARMDAARGYLDDEQSKQYAQAIRKAKP